MKVNPHRTPEKVFHEKVIAKAKELMRTEPLVVTTFVQCKNKKCNQLLFAFVSAQYPILKVTCPKCTEKNERQILSNQFINHNVFELAKDYVIQEMEIKIHEDLKASNALVVDPNQKVIPLDSISNEQGQVYTSSNEEPKPPMTLEDLEAMKESLEELKDDNI